MLLAKEPESREATVVAEPGLEAGPPPTRQPALLRRTRGAVRYLGFAPFALFVLVFLLWPTWNVIAGSLQDDRGNFTLVNVAEIIGSADHLGAFVRSVQLSVVTAVAGAVLGALLSWAVAEGKPDGILRRIVIAASGVLAQFGGVMLAFAFLATFGFNGMITLFLHNSLGVDVFSAGGWMYGLSGLAVVYTYFQIPLMFIVFSPAVDALGTQLREASDSLGGSSWSYWRRVAGPILAPSFFGAMLLLFTNAFSAYATAAALVSQGSPIVPLQIGASLNSEVILGQADVGKALALGMVIIVAGVMTIYALIQRRSAKWLP